MAARQKKPYRPSLLVTILLGVLTLLLGAFLGVASLVSQRVDEVSSRPPPEDREPGVVYYVKGSDRPNANWRPKRAQLATEQPGVVRLSEVELNDWSGNRFKRSTTASPDEPEQVQPGQGSFLGLELQASPPNFAFVDGELQLSTYLTIPTISSTRKFVYRVLGGFEADADGAFRFVPRTGSLGRAPLVEIPLLGDALHQQMRSLFDATSEWEELAEHWDAVSGVTVEDDTLVLTIE